MWVLLALGLLLSLPSVGLAAIAEVASMRATKEFSNVDSTTQAYPNNITAGDLLIVAGTNWNTGTTTMSVTGCSTTFSVLQGADTSANGGVYKSFIAYGIAGTSGACTLTIDPQGTGNYGSVSQDAFSGVDATPLDADGGSSTGSGTAVADSITTIAANALIIGVSLHTSGGSETMTPGGSYTQFGEIESATNAPHNAVFRIATTATSYSVDLTLGASQTWRMQTASFEPTAASGPLTDFFSRRVNP